MSNHGAGVSKGGGHGGGGSGRWLVSYADFMTLMFVVFIVLYATAKVDNDKFNALKESLGHSSIGIQPLPVGGNPTNAAPVLPGPDPDSAPGAPSPAEPETAGPTPPLPSAIPPASADDGPEPEPEPEEPPASPPPKPPVRDPMQDLADGLSGIAGARAGEVTVAIQDRGVVASVLTSVLFEPGEAELKPGAAQLLDQISAQLQSHSESILVEGAPDAADLEAPWDLASRRASAVVAYLVNTHGLAPQRFSVIGYGKGAGVDGIVNVVVLRHK